MKVLCAFAILPVILFSLFSCSSEPSAYDMLSDFSELFGFDAVIYSPRVKEGEDGYITKRFFSDVYVFHGAPPENYAVILNSRTEAFSECGVFYSDNAAELNSLEEMCNERIDALGAADRAVVIRAGGFVFYSTLSDTERVSDLWGMIIRSYT